MSTVGEAGRADRADMIINAEPSPQDVSPDDFRAAFRDHPAGVAVITADAGEGPVALTATSVASVSTVPPVLMFSISELASSSPTIRAASSVVVHLIKSDELDIAELGATSGVDRFADADLWRRLPTGEVAYTSVGTWIRGDVIGRMAIGGSTVIAVQAKEVSHRPDERKAGPLVYHNRTWHRLSEDSALER